jgi:hypothetical protein
VFLPFILSGTLMYKYLLFAVFILPGSMLSGQDTPRFLCFDRLEVPMDTIREGEVPTAVFHFTVCSEYPVLIRQVWPGCGCTVPQFPNDTLFPGKEYEVKLNYHSYGRPGNFSRSASMLYYTLGKNEQPNAEVMLTISGFVRAVTKKESEGNSEPH